MIKTIIKFINSLAGKWQFFVWAVKKERFLFFLVIFSAFIFGNLLKTVGYYLSDDDFIAITFNLFNHNIEVIVPFHTNAGVFIDFMGQLRIGVAPDNEFLYYPSLSDGDIPTMEDALKFLNNQKYARVWLEQRPICKFFVIGVAKIPVCVLFLFKYSPFYFFYLVGLKQGLISSLWFQNLLVFIPLIIVLLIYIFWFLFWCLLLCLVSLVLPLPIIFLIYGFLSGAKDLAWYLYKSIISRLK